MSELSEISLDDIENDDQRELAELVGIEAYKKIVERFGGNYIYIQKLDTYQRLLRNEDIRKRFNGYNFKELAHLYSLTTNQIRSIVSDIVADKKNQPPKGQISLFDIQ